MSKSNKVESLSEERLSVLGQITEYENEMYNLFLDIDIELQKVRAEWQEKIRIDPSIRKTYHLAALELLYQLGNNDISQNVQAKFNKMKADISAKTKLDAT